MIKIIAVGKIKEKFLKEYINEYVKRLTPYTKLEIIEVHEESIPVNNSDALNKQAKDKEAEAILSKIKDNEYVILLDLWGKMYDSVSFSKHLEKIETYQSSHLSFVIAGSLGPGEKIYQRANERWKLSDLTFTHQMTRVILLEQLYRSYMIRNNNPYHK